MCVNFQNTKENLLLEMVKCTFWSVHAGTDLTHLPHSPEYKSVLLGVSILQQT